MRRMSSPQELTALRAEMCHRRQSGSISLTVCSGSACQAGGCPATWTALRDELEHQGLTDKVQIRSTACHGFCEQGPLMVIEPGNILYCHLKPEDMPELVTETLINDTVVERFLYTDPVSGQKIVHEADVPFYRAQDRALLGQNKLVEPGNIEDYIAIGGYTALV